MSRASTSFLWRLRRKTWMAGTSPAMTLNRHCEPTGRREAPPDDRLPEAIPAAARQTGFLHRFAPRKKLALGKAAATIKTVVARLDRAIEYAAASRSISNVSGILGPPRTPGGGRAGCF